MSSSTVQTWQAMRGPNRVLAVAGLAVPVVLAAIVGSAVLGAGPFGTSGSSPAPPLAAAGPLPTDAPILAPMPSPTVAATLPAASAVPSPTPLVADELLGTDGRLTVLLLGSDHRASNPGHRMDAIMVVSVDPTTGESAAFSVPRDTQNFPMPDSGTFRAKVNGLYQHLQANGGRGAAGMKAAVARAFEIEIDHFVLIGFPGVQRLIKAVGGVDVTLERAYYDPYYWVNGQTRGWGLPAGTSHLGPADALIFARTRKGDSDFGRARRQQILVMAALEKVRSRGVDDLPALLDIAADTVRTDLPLERATDLFELFAGVDLDGAKRVVFKPTKYAESIGGSAFQLRLDVCRAWIMKHFPAVRPYGTWPPQG